MMEILPGLTVLFLVASQRIGELILDRGNTAALKAEGGIEYGEKHYPLFVLLHTAWLVALLTWLVTQSAALNWMWAGLYVALQGCRIWVIRTLGPYWTTRIISIPGRPLVKDGPYRFVRHPNYWIVVAEIAVLPLAFGAWPLALVFSILNGLLLRHRIGVEELALQARRDM